MEKHDLIPQYNDKVYNKLDGLIEPYYTVFDIGAHQGIYLNKFLQQLGDTGLIVGFEMNPDNISLLVHRFNDLMNVSLVHAAVSDHDGVEPYFQGHDSYTCNIVGHDTSYHPNRQLGTIQSIRLDTHYKDVTVDFMKIDVEGAEYKVLAGCKGIIKNIRKILLECHFDDDWPALRDLVFNRYGYTGKNFMTDEPVDNKTESRPYQLLLWRE